MGWYIIEQISLDTKEKLTHYCWKSGDKYIELPVAAAQELVAQLLSLSEEEDGEVEEVEEKIHQEEDLLPMIAPVREAPPVPESKGHSLDYLLDRNANQNRKLVVDEDGVTQG